MNYVLATTGVNQIAGDTLIVRYSAAASWGPVRQARLELSTPDLNVAVPEVAAAVIADLIAWAASAAGGSIVITKQQVLLNFTPPQVTGVRLAANFTTNVNPAFTDVGLNFDLAPSSHYEFLFRGAYTAVAAATGIQLAVNGPVSPLLVRGVGTIYSGTTSPLAGAFAAYDTPIAGTASAGATPLPFDLAGTISTNAAGGAFGLRARSEINGNLVTILAGSYGRLTRVNT